jgi:hypothetical protein
LPAANLRWKVIVAERGNCRANFTTWRWSILNSGQRHRDEIRRWFEAESPVRSDRAAAKGGTA